MVSEQQRQFENMMEETVPGVNLTMEDGVYQDEGVHAAWVGYRAMPGTTTCGGGNNHEINHIPQTG